MVSTTSMYLSRLRRDNYVDVVVDTIHVADAVADTDETYGAYAAAENNTFNNANGSINNANNRNNNANYSSNNMYGMGWGNNILPYPPLYPPSPPLSLLSPPFPVPKWLP